MNPYQILQVSPAATREEIRSAYRRLARRWHPDRFMEGPERDWANEKMSAINSAYRACMQGVSPNRAAQSEEEQTILQQIGDMVSNGEYFRARQKLMRLSGRSAEWNYLLGTILMNTHEEKKAQIYLTLAVHQQPDNPRYAEALRKINTVKHSSLLNALKKRFSR